MRALAKKKKKKKLLRFCFLGHSLCFCLFLCLFLIKARLKECGRPNQWISIVNIKLQVLFQNTPFWGTFPMIRGWECGLGVTLGRTGGGPEADSRAKNKDH